MRAAFLPLALLALLAACELPIDPDYDEVPRPAQLYVDVGWGPELFDSDTATMQLRLRAHLDPGVDRRERVRRVEGTALAIAGDSVRGKGHGGPALTYEMVLAVEEADASDSVFTLVPPTVRGVSPSPGTLEFSLWSRAGSPEVVVEPGADLRLPLRQPRRIIGPADRISWDLTLRCGDRTTSLRGNGVPPESLFIPGEYLPEERASACSAMLAMVQQLTSPSGTRKPDAYLVTGHVRTELRWTVGIR